MEAQRGRQTEAQKLALWDPQMASQFPWEKEWVHLLLVAPLAAGLVPVS